MSDVWSHLLCGIIIGVSGPGTTFRSAKISFTAQDISFTHGSHRVRAID